MLPNVAIADIFPETFPTFSRSFIFNFTIIGDNIPINIEGIKNSKIAENSFEEHIKTVLNRDSITGVNVKLYRDLQKYVTRIEQMQNLENEKSREKDIMKTLFAVSL